jgi:hypothetical protein
MRVTVARRQARVILRTIDDGRDRDRGNLFMRSALRPGRSENNSLKRHDKCDKAEQSRANASETPISVLARLCRGTSDLPHHRRSSPSGE